MATLTMKFSPLLLIFLSCFSNQIYALEGPESVSDTHFHTVQLSSFLPASACTDPPTTKGHNKRESTIKVFHRHGPCFRQGQDKNATAMPSLSELFSHDQLRVDSIHARLAPKSNANKVDESKVNLPVKSGRTLSSGNYVVTIGLGTPARTLSLIFDTGSDLTWTQCQPCIRSCYKQQDPIFNPSTSSSYSNISCNSAQCSQLVSATGNNPGCLSGSTCLYLIQYGDSSFTIGYFSKDELTLSATDVIPNFLFGCGQNNEGLFGLTAGIIGLGRDPLSLVSQTAQQYGKYFSYCLPSLSSSTGYLSLGKSTASLKNVNFTPFVSSQGTSFYFIDIIAITIGGQRLAINQSVFKTAGTIIDSGTVITRLPPGAYSVMSSVFKQLMARYPSAPAASILDTCFDLSNFTTVTFPKIAFTFGGNAEVGLAPSGILIAANSTIFCLAFAANKAATDVGIFGNTQQKTLNVVYDVAGGNLGFGTAGCS
ncbi:aspartyl protease family protein At5g10770-like [Primulina eburnea]|uniref:aspartyl protease family protein At5g10770-like n=1 Tax=Primulina eburnea TaxID=1245227 RepID=UPI003C6CB593